MARKRKTWVIYPEYFDRRLSRSQGRRVPVKYSVSDPNVEDISVILSSYGIPNRVETSEHHPSTWYERNGRILISKQNIPKQAFLVMMGEKLKNKRTP